MPGFFHGMYFDAAPFGFQWLDMPHIVWHDAAMKAQRIFYHKELMFDGVIEMVIWQLPMPTKERPHGLKYRLVYAVDEVRVVGYDNETGKGDHKHLRGRELPYRFVDVDTLVVDFYRDVRSCK
jgi:hypothetical protein